MIDATLLSRRNVVILATTSILLIAIGAWYLISGNSQQAPKDQSSTPTAARDGRVFMKDLYKYNTYFDPERFIAVEKSLYLYASHLDTKPDLYTGEVRAGSFRQRTSPEGAVVTHLLVDVYPSNTTYILEIAGKTSDGGIRPILIQCAPKDTQKDPTAQCISGEGVG